MPEKVISMRVLFFIILLFFFQVYYDIYLKLRFLSPNFFILGLVYLSLQCSPYSGAIIGLFSGYLLWLLGIEVLAPYLFIYGFCFYLIGWLGQRFYKNNIFAYLFMTILSEIILLFPTKGGNILYAPIIFFLLRRLYKKPPDTYTVSMIQLRYRL